MSERIVFVEEGHRYFAVSDSGAHREIPGVTRVLKAAGLVDDTYFQPWHAQRGQMVHRVCTLDAQGLLDEATVDPRLDGYLDAWREFKLIFRVQRFLRLEYIVGDPQLCGGYGGRADFELETMDGTVWVIEAKSGSKAKWHRVQLGGYLRGHLDGWQKRHGAVLYLGKNGRPSLDPLTVTQRAEGVHEFEGLMLKHFGSPKKLFEDANQSNLRQNSLHPCR